MGMEHRWNSRRRIAAPVEVRGLDEGPVRGHITDVGLGGVRLSLPVRLFRNSLIELVFSEPPLLFAHPVHVHAMVVWADAGGAGLMFCHLDAETLRLLRHVMTPPKIVLPVPTEAERPAARYA